MFKGKKVNVNDRIKQGITTVAVGAGMQVVDAIVGGDTAGDMVNYGTLVVGIGLPILIPGTDRIADGVAAVAAYKLAKDMDLAGKIGLGSNAAQAGVFEGRDTIGNAPSFFKEKKKSEKGTNKTTIDNTLTV